MHVQEKDQHLRSFLAVAQAGTLRAAAEKLQISQPALSKHLRQLECSLGTRLFKRHGRGMALTSIGQKLFGQLSHGFGLVDSAVDAVHSAVSGISGKIAIVTVNTLAAYMIPDLIKLLVASQPSLQVSVLTASSPDVVEHVERGYADIGLAYDVSVNTSAVILKRLHHETMAAYAAHDMAMPECLTATDMAAARLILPPRPYALRRVMERELQGDFNVAIESNSVSMSLDFAAMGLGLAILPHHLPEPIISSRGLKRVSVLGGTLRRPVAAIYRNNAQVSEQMSTALATIDLLIAPYQTGAEL